MRPRTGARILSFYSILATSVAFAQSAQITGAERLKANDAAIREQMMLISRQLGVSCTACHNIKNFADGSKREFAVAKDHMRLTQVLIDAGMDGKEKRSKADCYMCHRGKLMPDYKEPKNPLGR